MASDNISSGRQWWIHLSQVCARSLWNAGLYMHVGVICLLYGSIVYLHSNYSCFVLPSGRVGSCSCVTREASWLYLWDKGWECVGEQVQTFPGIMPSWASSSGWHYSSSSGWHYSSSLWDKVWTCSSGWHYSRKSLNLFTHTFLISPYPTNIIRKPPESHMSTTLPYQK